MHAFFSTFPIVICFWISTLRREQVGYQGKCMIPFDND